MLLHSLFTTLTCSAVLACTASLQQVTNFGTNPTNIRMYIYVPDNVAANPAVIVALHPCGGTASQWYSGTQLPTFANENGFIVIYPETPNMSNCWDVNSAGSLTHNGGGDAAGVISMVKYTLNQYGGDASHVYVMGFSSGGMMTNVLAGSYPDIFEAGAAASGTPFACFAGAAGATPFSANQTCAQGQISHTAQEWGNFVRNAYPGYTGKHTRMMIWHGLSDTLVRPTCATQALDQWSNVLGVTFSRNVTGAPSSQFTNVVYGDGSQLQGFFASGVGHANTIDLTSMLKFFGILSGGPGQTTTTRPITTTTSPSSSVPTPPASTTSPPPNTNCSARWGQCGGQDWTGPTCCQSGSTCQMQNQWYSQCL